MWPDDLKKIYSILIFELQHLEKIFWRARLAYLTAFLALLILPARTKFTEVGTSCLSISLLLVFVAVAVYDYSMEMKRTKLLNQLYRVEFELGIYEWLRLGEKDNRRWKKPYPGHFLIWFFRLIFWIILILMTAIYSLKTGPILCLSKRSSKHSRCWTNEAGVDGRRPNHLAARSTMSFGTHQPPFQGLFGASNCCKRSRSRGSR